MTTLKQRLQKIIREQVDTLKIDGEDYTRDDLLNMISDYSKELTGRRDRVAVEKLADAPIEEIAAYYESMSDSPEARDMQAQFDKEQQTAADAAVGYEDETDPLEASPKSQGMGRRLEGRIRFTRSQLRTVISEILSRS